STAAFIATGAKRVGEAVTSLGSTLVTKVLSHQPIFAPEFGVYSQPLGDLWLVGGSSNSGGAVLRHYFSDAQMAAMTAALHPDQPTGLNYYPLLNPGERFPHCDPQLVPRLTPRPESDLQFFQGLLEGIARIEHESYQRLAALGAPYPTTLYTVGGGAVNPVWATLRAKMIGTSLVKPLHHAAAYGVATLAREGMRS
ncbi:MAG: carbohydrate kinase FGGY, partial [Halothiobacillaceae bacterium]